MWIIFYPPYLFKIPPEIWRPITAFLLTTPGLGLILDTYFCTGFTCCKSLEFHG